MWAEIVRYSGQYESAVLTYISRNGYPFSFRCRPVIEEATRRLRISVPPAVDPEPGSSSLIWHRHDENLWNLHSFAVRGNLVEDGTGWFVEPEAFIPGVGIGGWRSYVRFLVNGRRTTKQYLQKRGLPRPKLNWDEWDAIFSGDSLNTSLRNEND